MTALTSRGHGTRPNPIQWIGYTLGRRLPDSMRDWVRNDLTGNHATARHMIRGMVPFLPLFTAFLLLPGAVRLRADPLRYSHCCWLCSTARSTCR